METFEAMKERHKTERERDEWRFNIVFMVGVVALILVVYMLGGK